MIVDNYFWRQDSSRRNNYQLSTINYQLSVCRYRGRYVDDRHSRSTLVPILAQSFQCWTRLSVCCAIVCCAAYCHITVICSLLIVNCQKRDCRSVSLLCVVPLFIPRRLAVFFSRFAPLRGAKRIFYREISRRENTFLYLTIHY